MVDNKKDNVDDWEDVPVDSSTDDWEDVPVESDWQDTPQKSKLESTLRGAIDIGSWGTADEIVGGLETLKETVFGDDKIADALANYEKYRDESRANFKAAEKDNPDYYLGGGILGGLATSVIPMGAAARATSLAKTGLGKLGAAMGTAAATTAPMAFVEGVGRSEADTFSGVLKDASQDAAIGTAISSLLPVGGAALGKVYRGTKNLVKGAASVIPGAEQFATGYKYSKLTGKLLSGDNLKKDLLDIGESASNKLQKAAEDNNLQQVYEELDKLGYKINIEDDLLNAIDEIKNITKRDLAKYDKTLAKKVINLGEPQPQSVDKATTSIQNTLEKNALKSKLSGKDVISDLTEVDGRPVGQLTEEIFDPKTQQSILKDKFYVGNKIQIEDIVDIKKPVSEMNVTELIQLRDDLNSQLKSFQGVQTIEDAIAEPLKQLNIQITNKVKQAAGDAGMSGKFKTASDVETIRDLADVKKKYAGTSEDAARQKQIDTGEYLVGKKSLNDELKRQEIVDPKLEAILGKDLTDKTKLVRQTADVVGFDLTAAGPGAIGAFKTAAVPRAGSVTGLASRAVTNNKVAKTIGNLYDLPSDKLANLGTRFSQSNNGAIREFGKTLEAAMGQEDAVKKAALWSLSQQPAFKEQLRRMEEEDMQEE